MEGKDLEHNGSRFDIIFNVAFLPADRQGKGGWACFPTFTKRVVEMFYRKYEISPEVNSVIHLEW
jgi:hypothetical protein